MILINTVAPQLFRNSNRTYEEYRKNTSYCDIIPPFETIIKLNTLFKGIMGAPNPINAARRFAEALILAGPDLDPQTLDDLVNRFNNLPIIIPSTIIPEIDRAFNRANSIKNRSSSSSGGGGAATGPIEDNFPFMNNLALALLNCPAPCNYFKPISDQLAYNSNVAEDVTNNVAPIWDINSELVQPPMRNSLPTFNKISPEAQKNKIELATATESMFREGMSITSGIDRRTTEEGLLRGGEDLGSMAHRQKNVGDAVSYFTHGETASEMLTEARNQTKDCFKLHEYHKRYNPLDPRQNVAEALDLKITVTDEQSQYTVDGFNKERVNDQTSYKHTELNYFTRRTKFVGPGGDGGENGDKNFNTTPESADANYS